MNLRLDRRIQLGVYGQPATAADQQGLPDGSAVDKDGGSLDRDMLYRRPARSETSSTRFYGGCQR